MSITYLERKWLAENWEEIIWSYGPVPVASHIETWFEELEIRYSEPHRHYHTFLHIRKVLDMAIKIGWADYGYGSDFRPAELALYFHDVVYNPRSSTNEEDSAALAWKCLADLDFSEEFINTVFQLILVTKTHQPDSAMEAIVVDADLHTLAIPFEEYLRYAAQVTLEYNHVPEEQFIRGRVKWLNDMLEKPTIFHTTTMMEKNDLAKKNMAGELEMWLHKAEMSGVIL